MIPEFNDNGYLPGGIHKASLDEIAARFGSEPELRRVQLRGPLFPLDQSADAELWAGLPFVQVALVGPAEFALYTEDIYATDRHANVKGMIEVL